MAELYRTKTDHIQVEVNRLNSNNGLALSEWCGGVLVIEHDALQHDITFAAINVPTPHGNKRAQEGDWIIRLPTGEFYPVTSAQFEALFEAVVDG